MNFIKKLLLENSIKAYASRTASEDPLQQYSFRVIVPGLDGSIGFTSCSGVGFETEVVTYAEGSWDYIHKLSGRGSVPEITLERGEYSDTDFKDLAISVLHDDKYRGTIIIEHLDRTGAVARTYKLAEAWVSAWNASELNADSSDVAIESLTIQFEYYL